MRLTNLQPASHLEVRDWLEKTLELTPYQKEKIRIREIVRFAPFEFYKRRNDLKAHPLWRLTLLLLPVYLVLIYGSLPFNWMLTGRWGYGQKFYDNFHARWMNKLNL